MAEKLGVGTGVRELKIGQSFLNPRKSGSHNSKSSSSRNGTPNSSLNGDHDSAEKSFHSIRYDFKPASSNTSSTGFLDVDEDNRVSVKIQHEGSGQTNFSGHQKEANAKDCLLIIDHVTGEITLEKLSSQVMVKKTRSEKPESKHDNSITLPTAGSRPHTPNNLSKHESGKTTLNKKVTSEHKTGRVNHINSPNHTKNTTSAKDHTASNIKLKGGDNLSSASSDSSTDSDSDCDSPNDIGKSPKSSVRPSQSGYSGKTKHIPQSITGAATGLDKPSYKHSKQSSPSRSRVESPKQHLGENKPMKPYQSNIKSSPVPAKLSELNDEFDDSDESENEVSESRKEPGQDYSLGRFTPNSSTQTGRSVPNFSNFNSDFTNVSSSKKSESKSSSKSKPSSTTHSSTSSTAVASMPQFLNDDLELSESDSDS